MWQQGGHTLANLGEVIGSFIHSLTYLFDHLIQRWPFQNQSLSSFFLLMKGFRHLRLGLLDLGWYSPWIYLSIYLPVRLSVCLPACLSVFLEAAMEKVVPQVRFESKTTEFRSEALTAWAVRLCNWIELTSKIYTERERER